MLLKQSTRRQTVTLDRNNKEADTRLILHACEAVSEGNDRLIVICSDTDIPLLLLHFMPSKAAAVRMTARIAKNRKCYPLHTVSSKLPQPVKDNLLSSHTFNRL